MAVARQRSTGGGGQPRCPDLPYAGREFITYVTDRPGHDRRYAIDCSRIERELGWTRTESIATGICKTVEWYLANQGWVESITSGRYRLERLGTHGGSPSDADDLQLGQREYQCLPGEFWIAHEELAEVPG